MRALEFNKSELGVLAAHRLAVFRDRVILDAQPPIDARTLGLVEKRVGAPLPPQLVELWRTAFGGQLDYSLEATFDGVPSALSFKELFYPESHGYQDLWGWIAHEEKLARESGSAPLRVLPIGGLEYCERIYVGLRDQPGVGTIWVWEQGLPEGWIYGRNQDVVGRLAEDLHALFAQLFLPENPFEPSDDSSADGLEMVEAIDELASDGAEGASAAETLRRLVVASVADWRPALADGTIGQRPLLLRLAVLAALAQDDLEMLERLKAAGWRVGDHLRGDWTAIDQALAVPSRRSAEWLLEQQVPVTNALVACARYADTGLSQRLLSRGARVTSGCVADALRHGSLEVAELLFSAAPKECATFDLAVTARSRALDADYRARQIEAGALTASETPAELRSQATRYEAFAAAVDAHRSR